MIRSEKASVRPASSGRALRSSLVLAAVLTALAPAAPVRAQEEAPEAPQPGPEPCAGPEYRQFDFWVGEWEVWTERIRKAGKKPAHSSITLVEDGCAVQEVYTTEIGYSGRSLNYYDRRDGKWHQSWIDSMGQPIIQVGGMQGDSMVLEAPGPEGARDRITWTPEEGGKVRQHWTRSTDDGKTWKTVFDGMYHPKKQ